MRLTEYYSRVALRSPPEENRTGAKKKWDPNPWAVCTDSVGRENKEKYESCVMDVKKKQSKK